jgi:very-short-patch-repair endonuclease
VSVGPYIVDFYCYEKKLVRELDGYTHQGNETAEKILRNKTI